MLKVLLRLLCRALFRVEVRGNDDLPAPGKLLVIANHESFLDGLLIGLFLPFQATFVVHTTVLKQRLFRLLLAHVPHLAVDPTSPLAMKKVIKLLEVGQPVVIFPEGRITMTGSLMKVYDGPGFVAAKSGATILPVRLDGTARSYFSRLSGNHPRRLFPKITLSILPATAIAMPDAPSARQRRRKAGEELRKVMQAMIFASQPVQTLFSAFHDAVRVHGRRTRLLEDMKQEEESYGELLTRSLALGRLVEKVTLPGEAVGVLMPNVSNAVCLVFGMSAMRRVPAMLNYTAGSVGMQNACIAGGVKTIISSREFIAAAKLAETVAALQGVEVVYLEDLRLRFGLLDKLWLFGFARWFPGAAAKGGAPDDAAVVLFTSGSEGKPKGVVHSHRGILANIAQIRAVIDFSPSDKFMVTLPLFHAFGFTCGAIMPLVTGSRMFLYPSPLHYRIIPEIIYDRGCTVLFGTSTFLGNYARFAHPYDFYKLRYVVAGAEKLNEEVRKSWMDKFGIRILEGYGATECAPVLAVNTPMACRTGSVGPLLPGIEARVEAVPGIERGGLLNVRGPNVMLGYYLYDQPGALTPPADGWYSTGDVVEIDSDGFVQILGRVKRFAKIAGEMVSLESVEQIAQRASAGALHAAVTQPDAQRGENIVLYSTDAALGRDALQAAARELGSPELAVPRKIVLIDALPLLQAVWEGIDPLQVWDCHAHLIGSGDSGGGAWFSPDMDSLWHPLLRLQKLFYMNAGCVQEAPGRVDWSYIERLHELIDGMRLGCKAMLLAFDWRHDAAGKPDPAHSLFHIPNTYAAGMARLYPAHFEWVASIHPYRPDCVEALQQAVRDGARAIKWLPSAMGIDPASPRCDSFYAALVQTGLPLISHAGRELAVLGGNQDDGNPLKLRRAMEHGVRVVVAHCASDGNDVDLDQGLHGPRVKSFDLFARLMNDARYAQLAYADISGLTQLNRAWALKAVLQHRDWHARLLNGSDYPLPGVMPLFSAGDMVEQGLLDAAAVPLLKQVRAHNPLLFDFALKRLLRLEGRGFPTAVFHTRDFFERRST